MNIEIHIYNKISKKDIFEVLVYTLEKVRQDESQE